jgi:AcrR family transcriptional regulator
MIDTEYLTQEKIVLAALELFFDQGIKKTSIEEIAHRAGVTRITVYRYFADKRDLVRAAFFLSERAFQQGLADLEQRPDADWERILDQIGEGLSALPSGDLFTRLDELKRLYPDVYAAYQEVRMAAMNGLFDRLFAVAQRQGLLRPGLNRTIVQGVFQGIVIHFFDHPEFQALGLSNVELFHTMKNLLLYGILKGDPPEADS